MSDTYLTFGRATESLYKVKGSKHFGFAFPVASETDIKKHLEELRAVHHSAGHHCYAWRLGADGERFRANDDGEPSNSAGKPILGQLQSFGVTNVLIVVVRYFGGTKLGVGGLIDAYRSAAREAIEANEIIEKTVMAYIAVSFDYQHMGAIMRLLKEFNAAMVDHDFGGRCSLTASIRKTEANQLINALSEVTDHVNQR